MGFSKIGEEWEHINEADALRYLILFRDNYLGTGIKWHRYVHSEHIKVIVEGLSFNNYIVRSVFRSVLQYVNFQDLSSRTFWNGAIYHFDDVENTFTKLYSHPPLSQSEFRELAREFGTTGNF